MTASTQDAATSTTAQAATTASPSAASTESDTSVAAQGSTASSTAIFQSIKLENAAGESLDTAPATVGKHIVIKPELEGDATGYTFNYVWLMGTGWNGSSQLWDSTVHSTGAPTTETSGNFTPTHTGTYTIFVDVIAPDGTTSTKQTTVNVIDPDFAFDSLSVSHNGQAVTSVKVGTEFELTPTLSGDTEGVSYNYVWCYNGSWDKGNWSSDVWETGKTVNATSKKFSFTRPGTYYLYVDAVAPSGAKVTKGVQVVVKDYDYKFSGVKLSTADKSYENYQLVKPGTKVDISTLVQGETDKLQYNYVWLYNGSWAPGNWSSDVLRTSKMVTSTTSSFTPTKEGTYTIFVDVVGPSGKKETKSATLTVSNSDYIFSGMSVSASNGQNPYTSFITPGTSLTISPNISGNTKGVTYNYVWVCNNTWDSDMWSSTIKTSGKATDAKSYTFTPTKAGLYTLYLDVIAPNGKKTTVGKEVYVMNFKGFNVKQKGDFTWGMSVDGGAQFARNNQIKMMFTWRYLEDGSPERSLTGWWTSLTQRDFDVSWNGRKSGRYELAVHYKDPTGREHKVTKQILFAPNGKIGWQNPSGYYQVSSNNVRLPNAAYGIPFSYATPSRIAINASRQDCINAFVQRAYEYLGTPYRWNYSRQPGVGVGCIGLVYQCAYAAGMNLGDFNPYDHYYSGVNGWHSHDSNNMWNYGKIKRIPISQVQRGDLIFWSGHVAIYIGNGQIIEASSVSGRVVKSSMWRYKTLPMYGAAQLFVR